MTTITAIEQNNQDLLSQLAEEAIALTQSFIRFCQTAYTATLTATRQEKREAKDSLGWVSSTLGQYGELPTVTLRVHSRLPVQQKAEQ